MYNNGILLRCENGAVHGTGLLRRDTEPDPRVHSARATTVVRMLQHGGLHLAIHLAPSKMQHVLRHVHLHDAARQHRAGHTWAGCARQGPKAGPKAGPGPNATLTHTQTEAGGRRTIR